MHNGIIVNQEFQNNSEHKINYEGYNVKATFIFYEELSEIYQKDPLNFISNFTNFMKKIDGNYSIHFRILN